MVARLQPDAPRRETELIWRPGYLALGGNGGLETYAIRLADGDMPELVVAIDRNSSDPDDIWPIAATLAEALERLRVQPDGPWDR